MRNAAVVFLVLAIAFIAIGISQGRRAFLFAGIAFLVVAFLRTLRRR